MNKERILSQFSSTSEVLQCVLNAYCQLSSNEYVYDDENDTNIKVEDVQSIINQLEEDGE